MLVTNEMQYKDVLNEIGSVSHSLSVICNDPLACDQGGIPRLYSSSPAPWQSHQRCCHQQFCQGAGSHTQGLKKSIVNVSKGSTIGHGGLLGLSLCFITVTASQAVLTRAYCSDGECTQNSVLTFALHQGGVGEVGSLSFQLKTNSFFQCLRM